MTSSSTLPLSTTKAAAAPGLQQSLTQKKGIRFKLILCTLLASLFIAAMDLTVLGTALPAILEDIHGSEFLWVSAAYSLASTAFLPMSGGVAEIFGRQPAMLLALGLFALGSALCGSAKNMSWLIGGRTVQGLGAGAIQSLTSIIISDLVSLQERGIYNAFVGLAWAFASVIGPLVGGSLADQGKWRWLFYLNLPICGVAVLAVVFILRLPIPQGTLSSKLKKMDWIGNLLIISSTSVFVIGLSWGGATYPWSSAHVVTTLVVGLVGFVVFLLYEAKWAANPIVPISILSNRSSLSGYIQNFIAFFIMISRVYFVSVFWQVCKDGSPIRTGVMDLAPATLFGLSIVIFGASVAMTKRYRPQLWASWVLIILGFGLMIHFNPQLSNAHIIGISIIPAIGLGAMASVGYFPVLAPLHVTQNAYALAFFAFGRAFAGVWGISIGNTVFQNELQRRLQPQLIQSLEETLGVDLSDLNVNRLYGALPLIRFLPDPPKAELQQVLSDSISTIWMVLTGVAGLGLLSSLLMKAIPLQNVKDEKWTDGNLTADKEATENSQLGSSSTDLQDESKHADVRV
ncbi:hypothetical protein PM082_018470 [Marasmius tenuissimus]|nr:hypothetical protein PM082_018470 [Marasmius tenuissimus]